MFVTATYPAADTFIQLPALKHPISVSLKCNTFFAIKCLDKFIDLIMVDLVLVIHLISQIPLSCKGILSYFLGALTLSVFCFSYIRVYFVFLNFLFQVKHAIINLVYMVVMLALHP